MAPAKYPHAQEIFSKKIAKPMNAIFCRPDVRSDHGRPQLRVITAVGKGNIASWVVTNSTTGLITPATTCKPYGGTLGIPVADSDIDELVREIISKELVS
jgi:hypothetical protein